MRITGRLRQFGHIIILNAPAVLLKDRRRRRVQLTINSVGCRTHLCQLQSGITAIIVPNKLRDQLGLYDGQDIVVDIEVPRIPKQERIPSDLREALDATQCDMSNLPAFERRQLIVMVKEASSPEVRRRRIEAVIRTCNELDNF